MLTQRLAHPTLALLLLAAAIGCGQSKHKAKDDGKAPEAQPETTATPAETFDPEMSAEYDRLPSTVLIAADADEAGNPVAGTEEMRVPGGDAATTTDLTDADAAAQAFDSGTPASVAASSDELDQDTSAQAWTSYKGTTDYNTYQPQVYSKKARRAVFKYGKALCLRKGRRVIYVYHRPTCTPVYCSTNNGSNQGPGQYPGQGNGPGGYPTQDYDGQLRTAFATYGVFELKDDQYYSGSPEKIELGARLFYDTLLSAHNDLSCSSCHVQQTGTTSFYSLGATGEVMTGRKQGNLGRNDLLGRNAPALYNVGHKSLGTMFWDSRVSAAASEASGYLTPVGDALPRGLDSALAVQALFPLVGSTEMGCGIVSKGSSESLAAPNLWQDISTRILGRQDYQQMFAAAFPEVQNGHFGIEHVANAIAVFESSKWRANHSPFDRYVAGDLTALSDKQKAGASYFFGKAECASCHSGPLLTDHGRHSIAIPQFGPGAGDGPNGYEDYGFGRISRLPADNFKFKTPSLRNVAATGPWGHNGAYRSLRSFVEHYRNPKAMHDQWNPAQAILPSGFYMDQNLMGAWADQGARGRIQAASEIDGIPMTDAEVEAIMEFLLALSDPTVAQNSTTVFQH